MKQGTIWRVNLDPSVGAEMKKNRPCVIVNSNRIGKLPLKIVAPLTDFKKLYKKVPWMVVVKPTKANGLLKASVIDLFQVRSVSQKRLVTKLGIIDGNIMDACKEALNIVFE